MEVGTITFKNVIESNSIIKPNFHLNYGKKRIANAIRNGMPFRSISECVTEIYTGGIFKRIFVEEKSSGIPYISAQHMMHFNPLEVAKLISKKFTPRQNDMTLREGQILVSCAGTVGNVRVVDKFLDGVIGSQDIIRVIANDQNYPQGYIYGFLSSRTAYNYIQSFIYGSVVPRIDPLTLGSLPVPDLDFKLQLSVHEKMVEASAWRHKAYKALKKAVDSMEVLMPPFVVPHIHYETISSLENSRKRLDATYSAYFLKDFYDKIDRDGIELKTVEELCTNVFTPNIFKRIKVEESKKSIPYLGGAELLHYRPSFDTFLSAKTKNLESYILRKGNLAFQDSGSIQSIGYVSIIPNYLDGIAATNNLVRVVGLYGVENSFNPYIYAFFKTKQANAILKSLSYGTGQLHIDTEQVQSFRIPIFTALLKNIHENVSEYLKGLEKSYFLESEAISIIENEIEKWQK